MCCWSSLHSFKKMSLCVEACPPLLGDLGGRPGPWSLPFGGEVSATILVISRIRPASTGCT